MQARGDYIGGRFLPPTGDAFSSHDPSEDERVVLTTAGSVDRAAEACAAAAEAAAGWAARSFDDRLAVLARFRAAIADDTETLAEAISLEMGKVRSEARTEIGALLGRFPLAEAAIRADLKEGALPDFPDEALSYRPHGVVAVLGPFNFPLHLCHAHVVPALLLGNTVVIKPSEITPLAGQRYAESAHRAGLPPGVLNLVQGDGRVGAALGADPRTHALCFTGSWATGRKIAEAALDRPEMLLALEMGGKNTCVVLEDAELRQTVHEILTSGYLTTGQRCTCSDRILVHRRIAPKLIDALVPAVRSLRFGRAEDHAAFAGPLATVAAKGRFRAALERARAAGAEVLFEGEPAGGGAFVGASIHQLPDGVHDVEGYTDEELFGPDLCLEIIDDDEEAIRILEASPYGFATSVFTRDVRRFEGFRTALRTGILNHNRSTNQASPRLPFGGVKRSGNFRPAGAWAARNLVYPVAHRSEVAGAFTAHPALEAHLPAPDLDALEAVHREEEAAEARRSLLETPRPLKVLRPPGGELPASSAALARYHAGGRFVPGEKKPLVFDHLRSSGPYMVSIDEAPLSVLDGMSQTATSPLGFGADGLVAAYIEGELEEVALGSADTTTGENASARAFVETLRAILPELPEVSFAHSGAEANEKAYALCREHGPEGADRVLAFEGSFHGRTLLSLYASHNPDKRAPFELEGYEVTFAPYPRCAATLVDVEDPPGFREACARGDAEALARFAEDQDAYVAADAQALVAVCRHLETKRFFCVDVEPMQSEGGDRYANARFFRGLRLITRAFGVPLIFDEVQVGFGLGGPFLWHRRFGLTDAEGAPDHPDCVVFAKRAQVGVCMSRFADPEPTSAFPASLARGRLHALEVLRREADAARLTERVAPRLAELARRWSHRITDARQEGYAIAFELASPAELGAYLGQRFWRGAVVFGAGSRTVRYRLNPSFGEAELDLLFESMQRSLAWLDAHPGAKPPAWQDPPTRELPPGPPETPEGVSIRRASADEAELLVPAIMALEAETYEAARREPEAKVRLPFEDPHGSVIVAEGEDGALLGVALGAPLEHFGDVPGPANDSLRDRGSVLYSIAITVAADAQGQGIGRALKRAQLEHAAAIEGGDRYRHVSARNRLPEAVPMSHLADTYGAYTVELLEGQYEGGARARYYRMPLGRFVPEPPLESASPTPVDLAAGLSRPLAEPPESLRALYREGQLFGPLVNKVTVLNYITPAIVRATEHLAALSPSLPHLYLTSSRDETIDKAVRILRWHRPEGRVVLGLEGGYVGHTTACARSISDPSLHRQGRVHFDWPRLPHPERVGAEAFIAALDEAMAAAGGASKLLGLVCEVVGERSGLVLPTELAAPLAAWRAEHGVPLVLVEVASGGYRAARGPFAAESLGYSPDLRLYWPGGQLGVVYVSGAYRVDKPMTFVSTWDGDELSLIQADHQLHAIRRLPLEDAALALDDALSPAREAGLEVRGLGLHRVLATGEAAEAIAAALTEAGLRARIWPDAHIAITPPLDRVFEVAEALRPALLRALA